METNPTTCDQHAKQTAIPTVDGGAVWICEGCMEILGPVEEAPAAPARFEVGRSYSVRSYCDHDTVFTFTVVKRTAKFITVRDRFGDERRVGVKVDHLDNGREWALPCGNYSMAPAISADGWDR